MPTLRRLLKYTPAAVLGLLFAGWTMSWFILTGVAFVVPMTTDCLVLELRDSSLQCSCNEYVCEELKVYFETDHQWSANKSSGSIWFYRHQPCPGHLILGVSFPVPLILALILPFAIGPFISFRFRLWHYLAYTALVAVELAYYLRWQE